jgi:[acyl-carrier-protein] S-malonyltransferase
MPLKVSAAFHTPLMTPAADRLLETLSECTIAPLRCQVISNVTGLPYRNENEVKEGLYRQMTSPVQWAGSVEFLYRAGVYYFIDAGPRKLLRNQLKRQGWNAEYFALEAAEDITAFGNSIGSHLPALATPVNKALALAVSAKNYNYDDAGYEESVLSPFRKIKELLEKAELSGRVPVKEEMTEACGQLHRLLRGKRLQEEEITLQYDRLFTETGVLLVCPELKAALV